MRVRNLLLATLTFAAAAPQALFAQPATVASTPQADRSARLAQWAEASERGDVAALRAAHAGETDPDARTLLELRLAAMRMDPGLAADPRLARLAATEAPADIRRGALAILSSALFATGDYADAARSGRALHALQLAAGEAEDAAATELAVRIADLLAGQPQLALEGSLGPGRTAARRDRAGLVRIDVVVNGQPQDAVFDTGANISVLSASAAARLGVRILDGAASVGNSVRTQVPVRLGVADRLEIAGNVLRNAVFLVIDDAQLTFPVAGGYAISAIIGFPEMRALERFRLTRDTFVVEPAGESSPAGGGHNLHAWTNELFVDVRVGGIAVPLHLDSGANPSHLNAPFALAHPEIVRGLPAEERRLRGAGGSATGRAARWLEVPVEIAGRRFTAPSVLIGLPDSEARSSPYVGVLGADVLALFESYAIDFRAMRLELGPPRR